VDERGAVRASDLQYGHGSALWKYWTRGEGFAKWSGAVHKWTTLRDLLLKAGVPAISADGLTTNIITAVMPGYMEQAHAKTEHKVGRADMAKQDVTDRPVPTAPRSELMRDYPLEDLHIVRSGDGGDGRTMEAFAAVFNTETGIEDHQGRYLEVIEPSAFNKRIADLKRSRPGFGQVKVMFNHGRDLNGVPESRFMMPVATPVAIEATSRGLLTRSRFNQTPLAEEVLELVKSGSVTSMSFTGRIVRSDPQAPRHGRYSPDSSGRLVTVRRTELGLREFGPVLFAAYEDAGINSVRMFTPGAWEPDEYEQEALPPDEGAAAGEPLSRADGDEHSARYHQHALFLLESQQKREKAGLVW
jgi:HK97 family phage prohead protease